MRTEEEIGRRMADLLRAMEQRPPPGALNELAHLIAMSVEAIEIATLNWVLGEDATAAQPPGGGGLPAL